MGIYSLLPSSFALLKTSRTAVMLVAAALATLPANPLHAGEPALPTTYPADACAARSAAVLAAMAAAELPESGVELKYVAPFAFAKLLAGVDIDVANRCLAKAFAEAESKLERIEKGSERDFYAHSAMHGYLLSSQRMTPENRSATRRFLESLDLTHYRGTLNMTAMTASAALCAAEQWPDLRDRHGHGREPILAAARPRLTEILHNAFFQNDFEMDAFTYFATDVPWVRMLAEFSNDPTLRAQATCVLQKMVASTLDPWNQDMYIMNPYRSKGWHNLLTNVRAQQAITSCTWTWLGGAPGIPHIPAQLGSGRVSLPNALFWSAYPRNFQVPSILGRLAQGRQFPYIFTRYSRDGGGTLFKYGYQDRDYGLAGQTEISEDLKRADSRYLYKEIKRSFLSWRSETTGHTVFSVCQDNPERPTDNEHRNPVGYGENPYHRVFQHRRTQLGIYRVPSDYIQGKRYQLYVPFTRQGIVLRREEAGWVFCHTGKMIFAFRLLEPHVWNQAIFTMPDYDMLSPADPKALHGGWILETTAITAEFRGASPAEELAKFARRIQQSTRFESRHPESDRPEIAYTNTEGETLELTFFPPNAPYHGEYRLNGKSVPLCGDYLLDSPYVRHKTGSDTLEIHEGDGNMQIRWPNPT